MLAAVAVGESTGENDDTESALEGAIALAKFGQFERALKEFDRLLAVEALRVAAAKNILRCHLEIDAFDQAADCFETWVGDERFTDTQLDKIRFFLEGRFRKAGFERELFQREETISDEDMESLEMASPAGEAPSSTSNETAIEYQAVDHVDMTIFENIKSGSYLPKACSSKKENLEKVYEYFPILEKRKKEIEEKLINQSY